MNFVVKKQAVINLTEFLVEKIALPYLGIQLGGVRSTSQVAKSFMGTGLKFDVTFEDSNPAILKLAPILVPEMAELEATVEIEEVAAIEPGLTAD